MTIIYGLTDQGLIPKTRQVIRDDLNAAVRQQFGVSLDLSDRSILGQLIGILSDRFGELWELSEQVVSSDDPDKATGDRLDAICVLTGTFRPHAAPSQVTLTFAGSPGTLVPALSQYATLSTNKLFSTISDVLLLVIPTAWVSFTTYSIGDRVINVGNSYQCLTGGTSGSTGPILTTHQEATSDGSVIWTCLGVGTGVADTKATSLDLGPIVALSRDISVKVTSVPGLQNVTNLVDAVVGRLDAQDPELRTLRDNELGGIGSGPFNALRAALLKLPGVVAVTLFPNNTDTTLDTVPPHSVEALVQGGADQDIIDTIWASISIGIGTFGNTAGSTIDSQLTVQVVNFSRATSVPVYVYVSQTVDPGNYPLDGDAQVATTIATFGSTQAVGRDVVPSALAARAFTIPGVLDVSRVSVHTDVINTPVPWTGSTAYVNTPGGPDIITSDGGRVYACITSGTSNGTGGPVGTGTNITDNTAHWRFLGNPVVISTRQLATIASVVVVSTPGTP